MSILTPTSPPAALSSAPQTAAARAPQHFAIVGGGLLGMTLALRLAERGERVTILEGSDRLGGLADAWQLGETQWDRHYHVTLLSDRFLRGILGELGLDGQMQWVETKTGFYVDGKLYSLSNNWEFLKFPPLRFFDKIRLAWTIFYASKIRDWKSLENISVEDWLVRHSGRRTFQRIWLPLLKAKLGSAYQKTSAAFIWATIARMYAARRTGLKKEMFGYLSGGCAKLLATFQAKLVELGVQIRLNTKVTSITPNPASGFDVTVAPTADANFASKAASHFDRVVLTTSTTVASRLCSQLSSEEHQRMQQVPYLGIICASVLLKKPLSPFYVTNITDAWAPFTGVIEMTALVDPQQLNGKHLVYLPKYVTPDDPLWQQSDVQVRETFLAALTRMHPSLTQDDVLAFQVSRVKEVFALSTLGYSSRVPQPVTSVPGLYLVTSAQIVNGTLNVNETVRLAEESVGLITGPLQTDSATCEALATTRDLAAHSHG